MKRKPFGPHNESERIVFAEERFRCDVQVHIQALMRERGVTRDQLARRLNVSRGSIDRVFYSSGNVSIRTLARILFALGHDRIRLISFDSTTAAYRSGSPAEGGAL